MARIAILTHAYDEFTRQNYLLEMLSRHWMRVGHDVLVVTGLSKLHKADVAIAHVDRSLIPDTYVAAFKRYRRVVNGSAPDIRKRNVSRQLVTRDSPWKGPVIVKTDLNCDGIPEWRAKSRGADDVPDAPGAFPTDSSYEVVPSIKAVPERVWKDSSKVVERFLPEKDSRGYWIRTWVFLGDAERCTRYLSQDPIVKSHSIEDREPVSVPDELRAERERLGFDYGKFDFVLHEGKPVLFDANRTPSGPPPGAHADAANEMLSRGIDSFLEAAQ